MKAIYNRTIGQNHEKISNSILSLAGILSKTKGLYAMREEGETVMCEAISDFNDIPLEEVKEVEKKFLAMQE